MIWSWVIANLALVFGYLLAIVGIAQMLRHRRSPSATIAWLLAFVLLPYVGVTIYLLFGGRKVARHMAKRSELVRPGPTVSIGVEANDVSRMLQQYGIAPPTAGNRVSLCPTGVEGLQGMQQTIESAQRTLYIQTFIFSRDEVGRDVLQRIVEKAEKRVTVGLLVDGHGPMKTRRSCFEPLVWARAKSPRVLSEPSRRCSSLATRNKRLLRRIVEVESGARNEVPGSRILSVPRQTATEYNREARCSSAKY